MTVLSVLSRLIARITLTYKHKTLQLFGSHASEDQWSAVTAEDQWASVRHLIMNSNSGN
jgi:hypothetical protein